MPNRSYHQFCPVAYALDLVGDRWTLLIMRELCFGPRRFVDILRGLPGIGTNLLSSRLRRLANGGLISQRRLTPPSSAMVYDLTKEGAGVKDVIDALAVWGSSRLSSADKEDFLGFVPTMGALSLLYRADTRTRNRTACEVRTADGIFHFVLDSEGIRVEQGETKDPDIVICTESKTLMSLLGCPNGAQEALQEGALRIERGNARQLSMLLKRFRPAV